MNIYLLSQNENRGYDTFDSIVVVANSEEEAKLIHPNQNNGLQLKDNKWVKYSPNGIATYIDDSWATSPSNVTCKFIGIASGEYQNPETILASFNAG